MTIHLKEFDSFLNEGISPQDATEDIVNLVKTGFGWIDPDYAIEMFCDMTGISPDDTEVDKMLSVLGDMDLLYYSDPSNPEKKGQKVEFGEITIKEYPHQAPKDSGMMKSTFESKTFRLKRFDEFN